MTAPMSVDERARRALDEQYNNRARVPHFQDHLDHYARASRALRERARAVLDLPYGDGERQAIDLFLPAGGAMTPPLVAFIHGGYWQSLDRKSFSFVAAPFIERGAAVAVIGYDLAPAVDMDRIVAETEAALIWLYREGGRHGFDPDRIVVTGHSAGGHLAAMTLAADWRRHDLPPDLVKGVCALSGIFDLEPIRRCYLNEVLGLDPGAARRNSPIHLPPLGRAPVMITVGGNESEAFLEQSRQYAEHLEAAGVEPALLVQPGLDHFEIVRALAAAGNPATAWTASVLGLG